MIMIGWILIAFARHSCALCILLLYFTLLYPSSCTILGVKGRKSFLSAASLKVWVLSHLRSRSSPCLVPWHLCVVSFTGKLMRCHVCQVSKPSDFLLLDVVENWYVCVRARSSERQKRLFRCKKMKWLFVLIPILSGYKLNTYIISDSIQTL